MSSPFIGEIILFTGNRIPQDWAICDGRLLAKNDASLSALLSLIGTTYGGDTTTFALPDLRGRVPIGQGLGTGLSQRNLGDQGGTESHTLTTAQMPNHNHTLFASSDPATANIPDSSKVLANSAFNAYRAGTATATLNSNADSQGNSQAHNNLQPYLVMQYIICLRGIFPIRP